ncbi:MAG: AEC family transporter [Bifidobacteriaceae bacterium]|nr:AEC family transporter [Bifidobacteriaceae bacterium]
MDALVTPISFLLIIIVGYLFKRAGRFKDRDYRIVQRIVFGITIPCVIINSFVGSEHDASLLWITLFSFACSFIPLIIMYAVTWRKPVEERAFEMLNVTGFNTGNFCLPVVQSYYGPGAVIVAVMFDIGNSATISSFMNVFTTSTLHISPDRPLSEQAHEKGMTTLPYTPPTDAHARRLEHRAKLRRALKSLFSSVPFDIYIVMIVLMLMHIELPQWLADICAPGANANGFCSMLMVGMLMELPTCWDEVKTVSRVIGWRLVLEAICVAAAWFLLPFDVQTRKIVMMMCLSPCTVFGTLFTDRVLGNARLAGFTLSVTAIISLTCISLVYALV